MSIKMVFEEEAGPDELEKSGAMLMAMAQMGMQKGILSELLAFAAGKRLHPDQRRFLAGPIVLHTSPWNESLPDWLGASIGYDRLKIILEEIKTGQGPGWKIGPIEFTTLMYAASMDAPMRYEYAQIYMWAAAQANAFHYKKSVEEFWEKTGGRAVQDNAIMDPSGQFYHAYRDLCGEVRRKVVAHQIKREHAVQKKKNDVGRDPDPDDYGIQLDLFLM